MFVRYSVPKQKLTLNVLAWKCTGLLPLYYHLPPCR